MLRSDNGGEFCSTEMEQFLLINGIIHQKTNAYTPEQNGMCERLNRTIVEKAKCLLFDANLQKVFWAEAVHTAIYLRNRSIAAGLKKTPFELWTGIKPDVSNLRIFGSVVMVHVPKEKRLKWDKKAAKQILVGYSDTTKGYRIFNPTKKAISVSRDVIIMESEPEIKPEDEPEALESFENVEDIVSVGDSEDNQSIDDLTESSIDLSNDSENYVPNIEPEVPESVRRSDRIPKPKKYDEYVSYSCIKNQDSDPVTFQEAISRTDSQVD